MIDVRWTAGTAEGGRGAIEWGWFGSTRGDDYIEGTGARFHTGLTNVVFFAEGEGTGIGEQLSSLEDGQHDAGSRGSDGSARD
jgi:hypothetical protein